MNICICNQTRTVIVYNSETILFQINMEISVMPLLLRGGSEGVPRPPGGTEKCKIDLFGHVQSPKYLLGENFYLETITKSIKCQEKKNY